MKNRTQLYLSGRFFDGISSGMFMMALPWIMLSQADMGTFVALTALLCTVASFLITPFSSTWIDRFSRKSILVIMQCVQFSTALLVALLAVVDLSSIWVLALAQLIFWLSGDIAWSTNNAFTQENYQKSEYAKVTGQQEVVMQMTMLGAGGAGIVLLQQWSIVEFAFFAALASMISMLCYLATPYNRKLTKSASHTPFVQQLFEIKAIYTFQPRFYLFLALSSLSYPVLTFLVKLVPIYFAQEDISGSWFAGWKISYGLGALLCGVVISRLLANISSEHAMILSMFALSVLLFVMAGYLSPLVMIAATVAIGFFNAFNRIARINKMNHEVLVAQRGRVEGGLKMFSTMSQSVSYVIIALLAHLDLVATGFMLVAVSLLLVSMLLLRLYKAKAHIHALPQLS